MLKGKNLLPFKSRPLFRGLVCWKANRKYKKLPPLYEMVEDLPSVSILLNPCPAGPGYALPLQTV